MKILGDTLLKIGSDGIVESAEHRVKLSLPKGHYYIGTVVDPESGKFLRRKIITARGWEHIGAIAGIGFVKPDSVHDDNGIEVENPIIRREDGTVSFVRIRETLIGRAANGNLRAIDLTLSYDVRAGLATTLFDLFIDRNCPNWGRLANSEAASQMLKEEPSRGKVPVGGGNYLVYNMTSMEVVKAIREHTAWAMLADRTAATIVERNLMRRHFGFSEADEDGTVTFASWPESDVDWASVKLEKGVVRVGGEEAKVEKHEEEAKEDGEAAMEEGGAPRNVSAADLIKAEVRRIGDVAKCKRACASVLKKHNIRWGDIGVIQEDQPLLDVYMVLRDT